ncbi:MAG: TSUP family transporter, partial [Planctomycetota bacterium]
MDIVFLIIIGLAMGVIGGALGIGGAVFMIPAMTFVFGENQHLYQAASMICIFFVSSSSLIAHYKAKVISKPLMTRMVPAALIGILAGVAVSNSAIFEGSNDYILSRVFGGFLVYVAVYNSFRLYRSIKQGQPQETQVPEQNAPPKTVLGWIVGLVTGLGSGLLGMGAGTVATPLQQFLLKSPMKRAMSNSAMLIVCISWLGAIYKNATLAQHGLHFTESF